MDRRTAHDLASLSAIALTACWTSGPPAAIAPPVATPKPSTSAWIAHVGGTDDTSSSAVAVAMSPTGEVATVFRTTRDRLELDEGDQEVVEVARYTATGERVWLNAFASPACDDPMFGPVVRFAPDGAIIAGGMDRSSDSPCLWRIERDGRITWSHSITALKGVPAYGIDATGRIVVTGLYQEDAHVVGLAADGTLQYIHELTAPVDGLDVSANGRVHTLHVAIDAIQVASFLPRGAGMTMATVRAPDVVSVMKGGHIIHLAALDDTIYLAWDTRAYGDEFATHVAKLRGATVGFEHDIDGSRVEGLAAATTGYIAIGISSSGAWYERGTHDGKFSREKIAADEIDSVHTRGASPHGVAMTTTRLAIAGKATKRMSLPPAGTITTSCKRDDEYGSCVDAGFVAVFP